MSVNCKFVVGLAAAVALLSGCSAGDDVGKVASAGGSSASQNAKPDGGDSGIDQATKDGLLARAKCMREHGVNIPDPEFQGGHVGREKIPDGISEDVLKKASEACDKLVPGMGEHDPAKALDHARAVAKCLRENGLDVADPDETHGLQIGKPGDDPAVVEKAVKACHLQVK